MPTWRQLETRCSKVDRESKEEAALHAEQVGSPKMHTGLEREWRV